MTVQGAAQTGIKGGCGGRWTVQRAERSDRDGQAQHPLNGCEVLTWRPRSPSSPSWSWLSAGPDLKLWKSKWVKSSDIDWCLNWHNVKESLTRINGTPLSKPNIYYSDCSHLGDLSFVWLLFFPPGKRNDFLVWSRQEAPGAGAEQQPDGTEQPTAPGEHHVALRRAPAATGVPPPLQAERSVRVSLQTRWGVLVVQASHQGQEVEPVGLMVLLSFSYRSFGRLWDLRLCRLHWLLNQSSTTKKLYSA